MIFQNLTQRSPEWYQARLGIATASCFDKIMTPKKRAFSSSADDYANQLIAEMISGHALEKFGTTYWMEHGNQYEADALKLYALETGYTLDRGGFFTDDDFLIGASPDVRVLDEAGKVIGAGEIKCPAPDTHVANLLSAAIDTDYLCQVQGQMLVSGLSFIDWYSYNPDMPPSLVRTYRDEEFIGQLSECLDKFNALKRDKIEVLRAKGIKIIEPKDRYKPDTGPTLEDFLMAG